MFDNLILTVVKKTQMVEDIYFYIENNYLKKIKVEYNEKKIRYPFSHYIMNFLSEKSIVLLLGIFIMVLFSNSYSIRTKLNLVSIPYMVRLTWIF